MEFQCFEVKPEDDSKEITECAYDDKPSAGICFLMRKFSALVFSIYHINGLYRIATLVSVK